jgi:hypothetical protein
LVVSNRVYYFGAPQELVHSLAIYTITDYPLLTAYSKTSASLAPYSSWYL